MISRINQNELETIRIRDFWEDGHLADYNRIEEITQTASLNALFEGIQNKILFLAKICSACQESEYTCKIFFILDKLMRFAFHKKIFTSLDNINLFNNHCLSIAFHDPDFDRGYCKITFT